VQITINHEINWKQFEIAVPAFLMMITMPLTYSIANGIGARSGALSGDHGGAGAWA
jgi:xanthine/uracil/vitamin C permease (AzgA family)